MRRSWATAILCIWNCGAQMPPQSSSEVQAALEAALHGGAERARMPWSIPAVPESIPPRPSGESISAYALRHRVPKAARKSFARAKKLSKSGDHRAAAAELESTVELDPGFAVAYNRLGAEYGRVGRFEEAAYALERAVELDPDSWSAQYNLGFVLLQLGDLGGAERSTRRAVGLASEEARPHWVLGYLLYQQEATREEGLRHMQYAARILPEAKQFLVKLRTP